MSNLLLLLSLFLHVDAAGFPSRDLCRWYTMAENEWYIFAEKHWYTVAEKGWHTIAENRWYTYGRKLTAAKGRRAHHRCSVLGWPCRSDFSRALALLMASKGKATSISFLR